MANEHSVKLEEGSVSHLASNTPRVQFNHKIPNGVERVFLKISSILVGTSLPTDANSIINVIKNLSISPDQDPKLCDASGNILLKLLQNEARAPIVVSELISATQHKLSQFFALEIFQDENSLDLGVGSRFSRIYFDIQFNNLGDAVASGGTITSLTTEYAIEVHFDYKCADDVGYRQYIEDYFPVGTEHSGKTISRHLQSKRLIDSVLIMEPSVEIKKISIIRDTNEVLYESYYATAKEVANRIGNIQGEVALIDPPEFLETGDDCMIEIELGTVSSATQIPFLTEYVYVPEALPTPAAATK